MTAAAQPLMLPLFAPAAPLVSVPAGDPDGLRPYQRDAVEAIRKELQAHRSTLLVMATGLGKTQTFGAVAKRWPGRVLVLAHRDELITQARARMHAMTGEWIGTEKAADVSGGERIVVGSVQTLQQLGRLKRFAADAFDLVIVDEAHHAVAATYKRIIGHFANAKLLGVTATPDRQDELAMGQVFESVAFNRQIQHGIADGFLCPIRVRSVEVASINLAAVRTTAGDLNQGDLDAVMAAEEVLHGVARPTIELAGDRRTIVFTTSVANAHRLAEVLNRYRPNCARAVDGSTSLDERRATLKGHGQGEYQFLCNVGVLTEGYDDPAVACVAMARPTKSRALYTQCVGRGIRISPGKLDCLVLDFVGNAGRHRLVSAVDILAGKYSDDAVARAKKKAADGDVDIGAALEEAERDIEGEKAAAAERKRRAAIKAEVSYRSKEVDPFAVFGVDRQAGNDAGQAPADVGDIQRLKAAGIDLPAAGLTKTEATRLWRTVLARRAQGLASYKQVRFLSARGIAAQRMYAATASAIISAIQQNGWRTPPQEVIERIVARGRTPGEEG